MIIFNDDLKIFFSTQINDEQYFAGFSTKALGDGRDARKILRFLDYSKIHYKKLVVLDQIHSVNIHFFDRQKIDSIEKIVDTDGVITNQSNVVLSVRTADCAPLIFTDKKRGLIGISHQGWRGSLKKMAAKMIDILVQKGGNKEDIIVAIGPEIGPCCYDIDEDRYVEFLEVFDGYSDKIFHFEKGRRHLNLALLNYLQLLDAGVKKEHIDFFPFCTSCDAKRFFSFRRDQKNHSGQMFNFITMR